MTHPWLARFSDLEPVLVAPHLRDLFESSLLALEAREQAEFAAVRSDSGEDFWSELGEQGTKRLRPYVVKDGILHLPVRGVLLNGFPYQFFSYATGYEYIWKAFERGLADASVRGIAPIVDSPGGMVAGNFDLVDRMYAARGQKPVRAFVAESAYSAAYSIASVADRIVVSRTGGVGSIGVVTAHVDFSKALDADGVKVTFIYAGKHKVDGNPYEPLPDDVKARIQERIDHLYEIFVETVARNRNLDAAAVRDTEALTFTADQAIQNGLADDVGSLEGALAQFAADLTNPDTGDKTMSANPSVTVASVKADHPDVATALLGEGRELASVEATASAEAGLQPRIDAAVSEAVNKDRERVAGLDAMLTQLGNHSKAVEIVNAAKADGSTVDATKVKLFDAGVMQQAGALAALRQDEATAAGAAPAAPGGGQATGKAQTREGLIAEWNGSEKLQREYLTAESYASVILFDRRK